MNKKDITSTELEILWRIKKAIDASKEDYVFPRMIKNGTSKKSSNLSNYLGYLEDKELITRTSLRI